MNVTTHNRIKSKELSGIVHPMCVSTNVPFPFYNKVIRCKLYLDSAGYFQSSDQHQLPSYRCLERNSMYPKSEPQAHCPIQTCSQSFLFNGFVVKRLSCIRGRLYLFKYYFPVLTLNEGNSQLITLFVTLLFTLTLGI